MRGADERRRHLLVVRRHEERDRLFVRRNDGEGDQQDGGDVEENRPEDRHRLEAPWRLPVRKVNSLHFAGLDPGRTRFVR